MLLSQQLRTRFARAVRVRGGDYLARVRIREGGPSHVVAAVQGSKKSPYLVSVTGDQDGVRVSCDCPYFDSSGSCKHIWAVLVHAQGQGYLKAIERDGAEMVIEGRSGGGAQDPDIDELIDAYDADTIEPPPRRVSADAWSRDLALVLSNDEESTHPARWDWQAGDLQVVYVFDLKRTLDRGHVVLEIQARRRKKDGEWGKPAAHQFTNHALPWIADPDDRHILALLLEPRVPHMEHSPSTLHLRQELAAQILPAVCRSGRAFVRPPRQSPTTNGEASRDLLPVTWDNGPPWRLSLRVREEGSSYVVAGDLVRGDTRVPLTTPLLLSAFGFVFWVDSVGRLDANSFRWISVLRNRGELRVPQSGRLELLQALHAGAVAQQVEVPETLRIEQVTAELRPRLKIRAVQSWAWIGNKLLGEVALEYAGVGVSPRDRDALVWDPNDPARAYVRQPDAERQALAALPAAGFVMQRMRGHEEPAWWLHNEKQLPRVVRLLMERGWQVEAQGKLYRTMSSFDLNVSSGIDWFELNGQVRFGDKDVPFPRLLRGMTRGESMVRLDDGTFGILPEEWLAKYGALAELGKPDGDALKFERTQVGVLDAMLAALPEVRVDTLFTRARDKLASFTRIAPLHEPRGFSGTLREYQREGLGWMAFLRDLDLGGCLADDMGLGKTVQVLAMLLERRLDRSRQPAPSLVVVPRSVLHNWAAEAARFTPRLRVLDYTGIDRVRDPAALQEYDLVLTTYGTLRRDATVLSQGDFDYVILDEAQTVKNAKSDSAKAVRLLRGKHRLALSGTPIENHLGELWSLFDFLNPGMLGASRFAARLATDTRSPERPTRELIARAVRPYILRRTKEQVARDLPPKQEQTVLCDLSEEERGLYNELRDHYRTALTKEIATRGLAKSKFHILEALLRLRQAACHPGLIDKARVAETSAKIEVLLPMLSEVVAEGHKALVFSQFTSFLAIVKERLRGAGIEFEYLDGRTRDRAARVARFQGEPGCKVFAISLKAGGLGLNLTAADYVFLLDPWWNPAAEAQAIDRAHRIGQKRHVFGYRLVARDTVEELE